MSLAQLHFAAWWIAEAWAIMGRGSDSKKMRLVARAGAVVTYDRIVTERMHVFWFCGWPKCNDSRSLPYIND